MNWNNIIHFDVKSIFTDDYRDFHQDTLDMITDIENTLYKYRPIKNSLYAMWDGFLHKDIMVHTSTLPEHIAMRVAEMEVYILTKLAGDEAILFANDRYDFK